MHLVKCETSTQKYLALFCTATESLGNFGIHLNIFKNGNGIKVAVFALF